MYAGCWAYAIIHVPTAEHIMTLDTYIKRYKQADSSHVMQPLAHLDIGRITRRQNFEFRDQFVGNEAYLMDCEYGMLSHEMKTYAAHMPMQINGGMLVKKLGCAYANCQNICIHGSGWQSPAPTETKTQHPFFVASISFLYHRARGREAVGPHIFILSASIRPSSYPESQTSKTFRNPAPLYYYVYTSTSTDFKGLVVKTAQQ